MSKIAAALNIKDTIRIKTFELAGHTFKVKVPLSKELEEINKRVLEVPQEDIDARLKKMTEALSDATIEGIEVKEDDILVEGKSTKETVISVVQMERRIVEYFKLLVGEGSLEDLTYEEIDSEFPLQVQLEIVEKVAEAIQPGYKDARKN